MSTLVAEPPQVAAPHDLYDMDEIARQVRAVAKTLVTEDDEPVDNLYCAKLQRLLVEILYASLLEVLRRDNPDAPHTFLADANVAVYSALRGRALVPDVFLSVGVEIGDEWRTNKEPRCYFIWEFDKPPDVAVEIVSNKIGNELGSKLRDYARARVSYYVVYDAWLSLGRIPLRVYELHSTDYRLRTDLQLPDLGLGVTLWEGEYEGLYGTWLRWVDAQGVLLPTKQERADREAARADQQTARAERLAARLREAGLDPDAA